MNGAFGLILILILACSMTIAYLGPDAPRSDFTRLEYSESALDTHQDWKTYTYTEYAPDLEEISLCKQKAREDAARRRSLRFESEKEDGNNIGFRDMSSYSEYSFRNQVE